MRALFLLAVFTPALAAAAAPAPVLHTGEPLDRGMIARPAGDGKVYLGWRLLEDDPAEVAFNVYRATDGGEPVRLTESPVAKTTDLVDATAPAQGRHVWSLRPVVGGVEQKAVATATLSNGAPDYIAIPLAGRYTFQKVGIADLDGDRRFDYVVKQPNANIDPYEQYWKPSPDTYKLEAYSADGQLLWNYDLGWSIERGIWYSPYLVYDLDGDGLAEVAVKTGEGDPRDADGRVQTGPEYLTILDGRTAQPRAQVAWPPRDRYGEGLRGYNLSSRNQIGLAWLDGKSPSLIVARGTYSYMTAVAYRFRDGKLEEQWRWDNAGKPREYQGQGAHNMHAADVDGDGRQEVILGSLVLDDNGEVLWNTGLGHPDHTYVGDLDPQRPGLEIYFGMESRQKQGNGMCMVDARTGEILWGISQPTQHVHGAGLASDLTAEHPGAECYSAESDPSKGKSLAWALMHTAKGEVIGREPIGGFSPEAVYWDADLQRELLVGRRVSDYGGEDLPVRLEGSVIAVADVLGDWREEIIASVPGELRIYTTRIPAADRRVTLMQDPLYRVDVALAAMGYYKIPLPSTDFQSQ